MSYTNAQAATILRGFGFRIRTTGEYTQSVRTFQGGYALGAALAVDGLCGPATSAALARSRAVGGKASPHFRWAEFACKCGGRYSTCRRVLVSRDLLRSLETYRADRRVGSVTIISGYRCPSYNASLGAVPGSQHVLGAAADVSSPLRHNQLDDLRLFAGIGYAHSTGLVRHVDRRDVSGRNLTGGTLVAPTKWVYAG